MKARSPAYYQGEQSDDDNSSGTTPIAIIAKEADKTNLGNRLFETTLAWCCTLSEVRKRSMTSAIISCGALGPTDPEMDSG